MFIKTAIANEIHNPVAISDKELRSAPSFTVRRFELCTQCGAFFGIGYHGAHADESQDTDGIEELPGKLTEILAKDHRQNRPHRHFIDLAL